ncbi:MAG: hypothetical protein IPL92_10930 [Saprospiraceae bacterium]|nr:hypothetical protein [Candidatus Opimibacter iunctus]
MREGKLYQAIIQLNGHELNRLHRFILSPFFNKNDAIIRLFEWIKEDTKALSKEIVTKENVWSVCFKGNEPFDDGRFRKLQSDLLKLVEEYFAQESFDNNPIHKAKYLLETISAKGLEKLQSGALKTAQRLVQEQELKPASFYYYQYELEQSIYDLNRYELERNTKSNIESIALNLDRFYLAEKLRYYCTVLNHQHLAALNYEILFIEEIIEHVETHDYSDVPPIVLYYQILLTYKDPENKAHYDRLKQLIENHIHLFPESEAKEIIDAALNYGIKRMNAGEEEYVREVFNLYNKSLDSRLLMIRGQITPWSFKNVITIALRLREFDWVESFIHDYSQLLDERYRENAITFNLAQLYFYRKEYQKVIQQLSQVEYDDMTYNLNSKTLLMASYYELDEIEALGSLLDTFRVYLNRNKELPATRRKHYLNTISIVRKLSRIPSGDNKQIEKLVTEVESTQGVVSKNWILEKLAALK